MRICFVSDSIHTKKWVRYFADKGHEVHLISPTPFDGDKVWNVSYYSLKRIPPQIRIISFLINNIWFLVQMRKLVRKIKPDIVHAHYITDCGFLAALSGFHPLVVSVLGSDVFVDPYKSIFYRYILRFVLKRADSVMTISRYATEFVQKEFNVPPDKIATFYWGIDISVFQKGYLSEVETLRKTLNIDDHSFIVLSPRTMSALYGIEFIIKSIPDVIKKHLNVCFVFLRGWPTDSAYENKLYENKLQTIAEDLGVKEYMRVVSKFLEPEDMAKYYNMCDAIVSIPRTDGFSGSILEVMACGAIPIVGNLQVYREYLIDGENVFFVDRENPKDIAEKVIYCIEHPEVKERFYKLNREIIEKDQDWNKNALLVEKWHRSIAEGKLPE